MTRSRSVLLFALVAGCGSMTRPESSSLWLQPVQLPASIAVAAHVANDSSGVPASFLDFTNASSQDAFFGYGMCAFATQLRTGQGVPAWQSVPDGGGYACAMIMFTLTVPAHATRSVLVNRIAASGLVGAPPAGQFSVGVFLNQAGQVKLIPAGSIDLR